MCGFDSNSILVHGLIQDNKVVLAANTGIVVLLSRKWLIIVGGHLQMDVSYPTIPTMDGKPILLYRKPHMAEHIEDIMEQSNFALKVDRGLENESNTNPRMSITDDPFPFSISPEEASKEKDNLKPLNLQEAWKNFEPNILRIPDVVEEFGGMYCREI